MLPFDCDALLPVIERYGSPKFRTYAPWFDAGQLGWGEAIELVAFLDVVPLRWARRIFHWGQFAQGEASRLLKYDDLVEAARPFARANWEAVTCEDGLACLSAMRDGGWRMGKAPKIVEDAMAQLRHDGHTIDEVAAMTGTTRERVMRATWTRKPRKTAVSARSAALLGFAAGSDISE